MPTFILFALDVLIVAVLLLFLAGVGTRLTGGVSGDPLLDFLTGCGAGLGLLCALVFILLSLGFLTKGVVLVILAAASPFAWPAFRGYWVSWKAKKTEGVVTKLSRWETVLVLLLALGAITHLMYGYAPPAAEDEVVYQLALPQMYANAGHWVQTPDLDGGYYPLNAQLLYSVLFLFRKALIVKVFVWFSGLLAGAALWLFARRHLRLERRTSLLALTLFTLMPFTTSLHGITSADLLNLFFELLTLSLLWEPRAARRLPIAALAGVFGGLSLGTRPYSLMWVLALALLMTLFDRRFKETFVFLFVAGLVYCPWPLRDLVWTGNPFYPVALWKGAAADPYLVAGSGHAYANLLSEFIRLPLFLSSGPLIWGMGVLPFALAPMAFCEKDKNLATWRLGFLTILILILTMALPFRNARYFGQAFPLLALFGAMGFENFEAGLSPAFQKGWRGWILLMLVVPNLAMSVYFGAKRLPFLIGRQSADEYLQKKFNFGEGYDMMHFINANVPASSQLLVLGPNFCVRYYYPGLVIHGLAQYPPAFYNAPTAALTARLNADGIRYVLWVRQCFKPRADGFLDDYYFGDSHIRVPSPEDPAFRILYETPRGTLARIQTP